MEKQTDRSVCVTGARAGIGRAIAEMFIAQGARVAISDVECPDETARDIGATAHACDVRRESDVLAFIAAASAENGAVDTYVSNAGVGFADGDIAASASNEEWQQSWEVNVMASVHAARALFPGWVQRGAGRFVVTASAAGLLHQFHSASYNATKHAAVALAESLAIGHADDGIDVHCICPMYVRTEMTRGLVLAEQSPDGFLEPKDVAEALRAAIADRRFFVTSHPSVTGYMQARAADYDGWIDGMVRARAKVGDLARLPRKP